MKLNEYASTRKTRGHFYIPRSVRRPSRWTRFSPMASGIREVFSQMWRISDIEFSMLSDSNKRILQSQYGVVCYHMPSDCAGPNYVDKKVSVKASCISLNTMATTLRQEKMTSHCLCRDVVR